MANAWSQYWHNYFNFTGRATRSEYWWMMLVGWIAGIVLQSLFRLMPNSIVLSIIVVVIFLVTFFPSWTLLCRRLTDALFKPVISVVFTILTTIVGFGFFFTVVSFFIQFTLNALHEQFHLGITMIPMLILAVVYFALSLAQFVITLLPSKQN